MSLNNNSTLLDNILDKVNNLPSAGTSLNFKVVGGTTEPSNRTENMIWVNTSTTISGWVFSPTEPTSPSPNSVWICVGSASNAGFNAIMNNGIELYPIYAKQYVSSEWVNKTAKSWQNGKWNEWGFWYYRSGDLCEDVTGGWNSSFKIDIEWNTAQLDLTNDGMRGALTFTSPACDLYRCTTNKIYLNGKTLKVKYSATVNGGKFIMCVRLLTGLSGSYEIAENNKEITASITHDILSLPLDGITQPVYIYVDAIAVTSGTNASVTVHDIWSVEEVV